MTYNVKMMSAEDIPDEDSRKNFTIFADVKQVSFEWWSPAGDGDFNTLQMNLFYPDDTSQAVGVTGNVYIMNQNGKTVASKAVAKYHSGDDAGHCLPGDTFIPRSSSAGRLAK